MGPGFDIACGNPAIRTDTRLTDFGRTEPEVRDAFGMLAERIAETVSLAIGRKNWAEDARTTIAL